jgi:hypothetical protein
MKKLLLTIFGISLCSLLAFGGEGSENARKQKKQKKVEEIDVNQAFRTVYLATQEAIAESEKKMLQIESIDLAFATTTTSTTSGGVRLWVVSGKYSRAKSNSKKATFSFEENKNKKLQDSVMTADKVETYKSYLKSTIEAAEGIQNAKDFGLTKLGVEVEFILKKTGSGGLEIELAPVTPTASYDREKEFTHTITLNLKKTT